jgi:hypothetical protein
MYNLFLFLMAVAQLFTAHRSLITYYLVAFFLLATVLRFPLRVRELFLVR